MEESKLQTDMRGQLDTKELFEQAKNYAYDYLNRVTEMEVYPTSQALSKLGIFDEPMPEELSSPSDILRILQEVGAKATTAQSGGKYFGFVNGGILPVSLASKWMSDTWDQNSALYVISPISAKLEEVCEKWLVDLFNLPKDTAAGFVSGSSTAIICALATARNELLLRQGWKVNEQGLFGAPAIRIIVGEHAHSSVFKALSLLGLGKEHVQLAPVDNQGRMITDQLPPIDKNTLLIVQAGNVNSGSFDPINELCDIANKVGAWVHVDGAFGLWAAASKEKQYLVKGMEKASSWSTDAHKTLNAPYDCGIVFCRERLALIHTMQATGAYIQYSEFRDGMLYTPEMSRRSRGIELWATLKYLGKNGVDELVATLCDNARYFANKLSEQGFLVVNEVVFNQVLVKCSSRTNTEATLKKIQASGTCWCGGSLWEGEPVIRVSVCSWQTTKEDIDECVKAFVLARAGF